MQINNSKKSHLFRSSIQNCVPHIKVCSSKEQFFKTKRKVSQTNTNNKFFGQNKQGSSNEIFVDLKNIFYSQKKISVDYNQEEIKNSLKTTAEPNHEIMDLLQFKKKKLRVKIVQNVSQNTKYSRNKRSTSLLLARKVLFSEPKNKNQSKIKIQDFILYEKLGEGTYSEVYKAIHKATQSIYALKILSKERMRLLKVEENVVRQIKLQQYLNHPNLVELYGYFHDQEKVYLICQYCNDGNCYRLFNKIKRNQQKRMSIEQISYIIFQLSSAINCLHQNNIMHRDIKAENILLSMGGNIKLCDFGWAVYNPESALRRTFCGTPLYLAPELIQNSEYSDSIDIWAIGIFTFELLTGQMPFHVKQMRQLSKIVKEEVDYEIVENQLAKQFMMLTLQKQGRHRSSIQQLLNHPFLKLRETIQQFF